MLLIKALLKMFFLLLLQLLQAWRGCGCDGREQQDGVAGKVHVLVIILGVAGGSGCFRRSG